MMSPGASGWAARPTDEGILAGFPGGSVLLEARVSSCEETGKLADPCRSSISICKLHLLSSSRVPLQPVAVGHGRREDVVGVIAWLYEILTPQSQLSESLYSSKIEQKEKKS